MTSMLPLRQVVGRFLRLPIVQGLAILFLATVVYGEGPPSVAPQIRPLPVNLRLALADATAQSIAFYSWYVGLLVIASLTYPVSWVRRPLLMGSLGATIGIVGGLASWWLSPTSDVFDFHHISYFMKRQETGLVIGGTIVSGWQPCEVS